MKRRELLKNATALGVLLGGDLAYAQGGRPPAPAGPPGKKYGPNDKIRVGMIGVGNFGTINLRDFMANADVEIVAVCDVFKANLDKAVGHRAAARRKPYNDYRQLLEDKDDRRGGDQHARALARDHVPSTPATPARTSTSRSRPRTTSATGA